MDIDPKIERAMMMSHLTNTILAHLLPTEYQDGSFDFIGVQEKMNVIKDIDDVVHKRLLIFIDAFYADLSNKWHYTHNAHPIYADPDGIKKLEAARNVAQNELMHAVKTSF